MDTLAQRNADRALIVDADHAGANELRVHLASLGLESMLETDVSAGLQLAREQQPALIMIDAHLPGGTGLEFLPYFKSLPHEPSVILMSSQRDTVDTAMNAMRLGAEDWLYRPFDAVELRGAVERALRWSSLRTRPAVADPDRDARIAFELPELVDLASMQLQYVQLVLDRVGGHRGRACEILGISRPRLRRMLADNAASRELPHSEN